MTNPKTLNGTEDYKRPLSPDLKIRCLAKRECPPREVESDLAEHFHRLVTEPEAGDPSVVMKVLKQRFSRQVKKLRKRTAVAQIALWDSTPEPFWQKRFYDFNGWSELRD